MDPDTFRGDVGVADSDIYWRRRVSVLTGVLVVVAVVTWACTSSSDGPKRAVRTVPSASDPGPATLVTARASDPPSRQQPGDPCDQSDLVVHLEAVREVYAGAARPKFLIMLVNTGRFDCTVDVGPRALEMRITSGDDRVWSTADCVSGDAVEIHRLERGVPFVRTVDWDRHRSGHDCGSPHPTARSGTYVALARVGPLTSRKTVFQLR